MLVLQPPRYDDKEAADRVASPGVSVGLVWTSVGGEVQFVEATAMVGKGDLHLTGQLGDVIKESAQLALTWVCLFICIGEFVLVCFFKLWWVEVASSNSFGLLGSPKTCKNKLGCIATCWHLSPSLCCWEGG